jgi:hypothetical protein
VVFAALGIEFAMKISDAIKIAYPDRHELYDAVAHIEKDRDIAIKALRSIAESQTLSDTIARAALFLIEGKHVKLKISSEDAIRIHEAARKANPQWSV